MIRRLKRKYTFIVMTAVIAVLGIIVTAINLVSYSAVNSQLDEKLGMIIDNEGTMPEFPPPEIPKVEDETEKADGEDSEKTDAEEVEDGKNTEEEPEDTETSEDGPNVSEGTEDTDTETESGNAEPEKDSEDSDSKKENGKKDEEEEEDVRQHMSPETPFETRYFTVKLDTDGTVTYIDIAKVVAVDEALAAKYAKDVLSGGKSVGYISTYRFMMEDTKDGRICVFIDAYRELESARFFLISSLIITAAGILMVFLLVVLLSEAALKPIIESYEKQKRFITDAGHEMKTPLTVISANAEVIEMENGESQWISGIKSQVSKLASLTEKLVILSKMEEGAKLEMNEFSLSEAIYDTCDQYKSIAMSEGVAFNVAISENVTALGNEGEIRRCATLLLDNAFRYVSSGGTVDVRVQKLANGAELKISNSTDGVEKGSLDRWFDRFYRTDLSRNSATGGSGIGLSVVKAIVNAHGGTVKASSPDGINVEITINI